MLDTNVDLIFDNFSLPLPIAQQSWDEFTHGPGGFVNGLVPVLYSISFLAVVTWFLTVFVVTNVRKSSIFLQGSTVFALMYMIIIVVKTLIVLHTQQSQGFLNGQELILAITGPTWINVIELLVILLLQFNQVQVIMRLFDRQSDKRLVFLAGVTTAIGSQILWSVMKFHSFTDSQEAERLMPALTYLVRIATNVIYATIFTAFLLTKMRTILANRSIWLITVIAFIFVYAPVAFFVADVTSPWAHEFSVVNYVVCVVLPWEWCNSNHLIQKIQEREGVLGRRFYEDELFELDRFGLFVEEDDDHDHDHEEDDGPHNSNVNDRNTILEEGQSKLESLFTSASGQLFELLLSHSPRTTSIISQPDHDRNLLLNLHTDTNHTDDAQDIHQTNSRIAFASQNHTKLPYLKQPTRVKVKRGYSSFKKHFLSVTDKVIAIGFEIPRSGSKSSSYRQTPNFQYEHDSIFDEEFVSPNFANRDRTNRHNHLSNDASQARPNRDVYIYSTKNVVLNPGDD